MPRPIESSVVIAAPLAETWECYFDSSRWRMWVDGFAGVLDEEGYPAAGGSLIWQSVPAGRGEVRERVVEHSERRRHVVEFSDPAMDGQLETDFTIEGSGTRIAQELTYRLSAGGPMARLASVLFVKGQLRESMRRSLEGLKREVEATRGQ